jgi:hypothetical protein
MCRLPKRSCPLSFRNKCMRPLFARFSARLSGTSVSPASSHSCNCSILFYNRRYVFSTPTASLNNKLRKNKYIHFSFPIFARSIAGIVGSNPTEAWIFVYVYSVFVLGSGLAIGWSLIQGGLPTVRGRNQSESRWQAEPCFPPACTLVSCLAYSSTLKMEAICSSETSVDFQRTTWRYIPEDRTLHMYNLFWLTFKTLYNKNIPEIRTKI